MEAYVASTGDVAHCLNAGAMGRIDYETEAMIAHTLRGEGFDASEDGSGRGTPLVPVAFQANASGDNLNPTFGISGTLKAGNNGSGNGQAIAIQEAASRENPASGPSGSGVRQDGTAFTMEARQVPQAVAYDMRGRDGGAQFEGPHDTENIRAASGGSSRSYVAQPWAVRRLTTTECHRLQGFPDGWCNIPWRGKSHAPDGPQYKALGNSMAVNVMRWIGRRIEMIEREFPE